MFTSLKFTGDLQALRVLCIRNSIKIAFIKTVSTTHYIFPARLKHTVETEKIWKTG